VHARHLDRGIATGEVGEERAAQEREGGPDPDELGADQPGGDGCAEAGQRQPRHPEGDVDGRAHPVDRAVDERGEQVGGTAVDAQVVETDVDPAERAARELGGALHGVPGLHEDPQPAPPVDEVEGPVDLLGAPDHREQDLVGAAGDGGPHLAGGPRPVGVDAAQHPTAGGSAHALEVAGRVPVDLRAPALLAALLAPVLPVDHDPRRPGDDDVAHETRLDREDEQLHGRRT
jgi:hypothetical protein